MDKFKFALRNAFNGIKTALITQKNLRLHLLTGMFVIFLGVVLQISVNEFLLIILTILCVIISEFFNTAIEFVVDLISPDYSLQAKKAKDISAAAVLIAAFIAITIGMVIFIPKFINILKIIF